MRKRLSLLLFLCLCTVFLCVTPVRAHLIGAFQDFLVGLNNKNSTKELEEAIQRTNEQHTVLKEKEKEQKQIYTKEQEKMLEKMTFYDTVAFDTYASFLFENQEMVDVLANQKIMKRILDKDIEKLESFYGKYQQLSDAKESVQGYKELLKEIEKNNKQKQWLSDAFGGLEKRNPMQFASVLQAMWNQDMKKVDEHLEADAKKVSQNLGELLSDSHTNQINTLDYRTINKHTTLTYLIQKDHVYITYKKNDAHLILISQLVPYAKQQHAYTLQIEAGFLNGYAVSQKIIDSLNGKFILSYKNIQTKKNEKWMVQQTSNAFVFQPSGTIMD